MLTILYGSQTGTAEEVALQTGRDAYRLGYTYTVFCMDAFDWNLLPTSPVVLFVCSTTGEGEEPDNMKKFWRFLRRRDLPVGFLKSVKVGVFGLGDSSYEQFNFAGKKLFRRLVQLGAVPLLERGDGDDQHPLGLEGALIPWLKELWTVVNGLASELGWILNPSTDLAPQVSFEFLDEPFVANPASHNATLVLNKRMTSVDPDVKDVRLLRFETALLYEPGDVAVLRPFNSPQEVDSLLEAMNWTEYADRHVKLTPSQSISLPIHVPQTLTIRELLTQYLDLNRPPNRYFFKVLSHFVSEEHPLASAHREKLLELGVDSNADALDMYLDYVWRPKRKPVEVLRDFSSLRIPLVFICELFPWTKPRSFSIASYAPGTHVDLLVALVRYKTIMQDDRWGLCSRWLEFMIEGQQVSLSINIGSMHLTNSDSPIVLMCAGTGIASMLSIIQKLAQQQARPDTYLFFGCRKVSCDALVVEDLRSQYSDWLTCFYVGSRDGPKGVAKVYLPDILRQNSAVVSALLLNPQSQWFLSGNSKLPAGVKAALAEIASASGTDDPAVVKALVQSGRFHSETWS